METTYYTTTTSGTLDPAATAGLIVFTIIASLIGYVIGALLLSRIFKKAGIETWAAWVPIYNSWRLLEIGGQHGWWVLLSFVPFVNIVALVFHYIAMYHIGLKLGKSGAFVVLGIFLPIVWLIWLAVDKSTWNESASTAPSIGVPPAKAA